MAVNLLVANRERVLKEAAIVRDWLCYRFFHAAPQKNYQIALEVEVTDFKGANLMTPFNTGLESSSIWVNNKSPAAFLFANAGVDLGNKAIRDAFLMGYATYLYQCYLSDQPGAVLRIFYQNTVDGKTYNQGYDAFVDSKSGELKVRRQKLIQRA